MSLWGEPLGETFASLSGYVGPVPPAHRKESDERGTASFDSARLFTAFDRATSPR